MGEREDPRLAWERYGPIYVQKMARRDDRNRARIMPYLLEWVKEGAVGQPRVLDLGCGAGDFALALAHQYHMQVTGVDHSVSLITYARQRSASMLMDVHFLVADARWLPFAQTQQFDMIVCNMALQDMADLQGVLAELGRVTVRGAQGFISLRHPWTDGWQGSYQRQQVVRVPVARKWRQVVDLAYYPPRYHRPLADYITAFSEAGWHIKHCRELMDQEGDQGKLLAILFALVRIS